MSRRRNFAAIAVSAACIFAAVTTVALGSAAAPQARHAGAAAAKKPPKARSYSHCETFWGCGAIPWLIYPKTKTWEFEGYGETEYSGTYEKVGKMVVFHYSHGSDCELVVKRVKMNYVGHDQGGCGTEGVELKF
jgi:hypothetical protein